MVLMMASRESLELAVFLAVLDSVSKIPVISVLLLGTVDYVNPFANAKIVSLVSTLSALIRRPIPASSGYLYALNPTFPFMVAAFSLALCIVCF